MADVEFTAGFQDLKTLQGVLENNIPKAARDSAAAMEKAFRSQEVAINKLIKRNQSLGDTSVIVTRGNQAYYNSILGVTRAKSDLVKALEKEERLSKEAAANTQREARELENLKNKYDPLYRASQLYATQLQELNRLKVQDTAATGRYEAAIEQLNQEYNQFLNGTGGAMNRFESSARGAQGGMNKFGMIAQQTGYQVGDFLVQIQGGTNPMVAFGQQATQLVGVLYLLPPALLNTSIGVGALRVSVTALIAGLGIAIPLATALGAAWMRTSGEGKTLSQTVTDLETSLQNLNAVTENYTLSGLTSLADKYGEVNAQVLQLVENQNFLAQTEMNKSIADTVKSLEELAGGRWFDIGISERASALLSLQNQFKITKNDADALYESFQEVSNAEKGSLAQADALSKVAQNLKIILSDTDNVTQAQLDALKAVVDTEAAIREMVDAAPDASWMNLAIDGVNNLYDSVVAALGEVIKLKNEAANVPAVRPQGRPDDIDFGYTPDPSGGTRPQGRPLDFLTPDPAKKGGRSGGGRGSSRDDRGLEAFIKSLQTEQEALTSWYTEQQDLLAQFNEKELEAIGGQNEAKLRLDAEYAERKREIEKGTYETIVNAQQNAMSALQDFMSTLAGQSEGAAKAVLAVNTAMSVSQAIQNTAVAATRALAELGPIAGPPAAAKIKAYGAAQVGLIVANAALKLGGSGGGGSSGGAGATSGAISTPSVAEQAGPQQVIIQGLKKGMRISPEELQEIFDQIYDENDKRGTIFQVQT